jgi:hypothetical protein
MGVGCPIASFIRVTTCGEHGTDRQSFVNALIGAAG